jgi:hypothetical protein
LSLADLGKGAGCGFNGASGGQALASSCTTGVDDFPAATGSHARTETVSALALQIARLKRSFHRDVFLAPWVAWGGEKGREF